MAKYGESLEIVHKPIFMALSDLYCQWHYMDTLGQGKP